MRGQPAVITPEPNIIVSPWWKFNRYELANGCIKPAHNAKLQLYDPWEGFLDARRKTNAQPPYQALFAVLIEAGVRDISISGDDSPLEELPVNDEGLLTISTKAEEKLLSWCSNYGLLGILSHRTHFVTLAARWKPIARRNETVFPAHKRYFRAPNGWIESTHRNLRDAVGGERAQQITGTLVSEAEIERLPDPQVIADSPSTMGTIL